MRVVGSTSRKRGLRVMLVAASAMAIAVIIAGALPVSAATTPLNTNLVKNPGAENALTNPPWDTFPPNDFKRRRYGPAGYGNPPKTEGDRIGGGTYFFSGGLYDNTYGTCPYAKQEIQLTGLGGAIDHGHIQVRLKGYAATSGAAYITAHLELDFFNAQHHTDNLSTSRIQAHATSTNETYHALKVAHVLPANARILSVYLWSSPISGDYGCQSSWDKLSVVLVHV
jgi:hypothetical protein